MTPEFKDHLAKEVYQVGQQRVSDLESFTKTTAPTPEVDRLFVLLISEILEIYDKDPETVIRIYRDHLLNIGPENRFHGKKKLAKAEATNTLNTLMRRSQKNEIKTAYINFYGQEV